MKTSDVLKAVQELLTPPEQWTKHTYARDGLGRRTNVTGSDAVCWCLDGAILKATADEDPHSLATDRAEISLNHTLQRLPDLSRGIGGFVEWNDHPETTHDDVMNLLAEAVVYAEARGD